MDFWGAPYPFLASKKSLPRPDHVLGHQHRLPDDSFRDTASKRGMCEPEHENLCLYACESLCEFVTVCMSV